MSRSRLSIVLVLDVSLFLLSGCATMSSSTQGPTAPSITTQPVNATVTLGQPATFSVGATGNSPLNYQWRKNSVNISGATGSSYTTPSTTSADNGAKFDAVVSNTDGSLTSSAATLTVTPV